MEERAAAMKKIREAATAGEPAAAASKAGRGAYLKMYKAFCDKGPGGSASMICKKLPMMEKRTQHPMRRRQGAAGAA